MAKKNIKTVVLEAAQIDNGATVVLENVVRIPSQEDIVAGLLENPLLVRTTAVFKTVMIPCDCLEVNEENRGGVPFDWNYISDLCADMMVNGWKPLSVLEVESLGKGKYLVWGGNNRLLAARKAGFLSVPCSVIPAMSRTDRLVFGWKSNEVRRNSPIETALIVGSLAKEGNKPGTIAALLFAGSKGGASMVSQYQSFIRDCPEWLKECVKNEKCAYKTAQDLIPLFSGTDKDSEATLKRRADIESSPSGSLVGIKIVKEAREAKGKLAREAVEKAAKEAKEKTDKENKEKADKEKAEAIASALSDKMQLEKHASLVKDISELLAINQTTPEGQTAASESLAIIETCYGEREASLEFAKQILARKNGATEGNIIAPTTPAGIKVILDAQGAQDVTPGTIESGTAAKPENTEKTYGGIAKTSQNNHEESHGKAINIKKVGARFNVVLAALNAMKLPADSDAGTVSKFVNDHCQIGADGHAYVRVSLGHATMRFNLDLGLDMVS